MSAKNTPSIFETLYIPEPMSGCWLWLKSLRNKRYGSLKWKGRFRLAHNVAYEIHVGKIPEGKVLDHTCRNTFCVNPEHLEPVSQLENMRRSLPAVKLHCKNGHLYSEGVEIYFRKDNEGIQYRRCLTCYRLRYPGTAK